MYLLDRVSRRSKLATLAVLVVVAAVALAASPREASAARIPVIYQSGQDAFPCGPLPEPYDKDPELAGCASRSLPTTYVSVGRSTATPIA
jgi:hypothetical protein